MALVTRSSTNYHYDYDDIQPYFLDGEEDFYPPPRSHLLPGPNEDIWKKFELLPTPPLSPSRTPSQSDAHLSAAEHLEAVSDLLDEDWNPSAALLQSFIIQDCMWSSSFAAATKLEQMVSERLASLRARRDSSDTCSITAEAADPQVGRSQVNTMYLQDLHAAASQCIDPSAVFPCATTSRKQSTDGAALEAESELCLDSPPLSSSDSESEEEEDGEEAEIDVVTVDRRQTPRRSNASPLVLKRSHINIHQHNYAAPQPAGKRRKIESAASMQSGGRRCWSPRSDGEDENKRRTHNVLEKQRRSELRLSFLTLRDEVPAVANNQKAAKVVILKKAREFIMELTEEEERLQTMKDRMMKRNKELKRRLEKLRT